MVDHGPLPLLMDLQRYTRKCPAFALAEIPTASKEEACTVKIAMHRALSMKTFEDRYLSNGGGLESSLFPHARISRPAIVMIQDRTDKQKDPRRVMS